MVETNCKFFGFRCFYMLPNSNASEEFWFLLCVFKVKKYIMDNKAKLLS